MIQLLMLEIKNAAVTDKYVLNLEKESDEETMLVLE